MTKKQIKAIKKDITENGIINRGYWSTLKNVFGYDEIMEAVISLLGEGVKLNELKEWQQNAVVLTECIKQQSYHEFKEKTLRHILGTN